MNTRSTFGNRVARSIGVRALATSLALLYALVLACAPADETGTEAGATGDEAMGSEATPADRTAGSGDEAMTAGVTGTATIAGRISYEGKVPSFSPLRMDADPECAAKHDDPVMPQVLELGENNALGNVLVRVVSGLPPGRYEPPSEPFVMDQRGCMYHPHVMALVAGQGLKILNSDNLLHNVHSLSKVNPTFNRAMPAGAKEATFDLPKPEEAFRVKCDVHPWMGAFVEVIAHPFFDVSAQDGSFAITDLPAGTYEIEAWHEKMGSQTASVTVADGESASHDFTFTRGD